VNALRPSITSPAGVSRAFTYDALGRATTVTETIAGSPFSTTFTYDTKGRVSTILHPLGIKETLGYNTYGYQYKVSVNNTDYWTVMSMNARGQLTQGKYGTDLNTTLGYNTYGFLTSVVTGSLQSDQYDFNPVTGYLNYRKNVLQGNIQENLEYDNLDRLKRVYRGSTTLLDMTYEPNKGGHSDQERRGHHKLCLNGQTLCRHVH
jgi:YD repeat-containing protein